jgi:hypothetical protein
MNKSDNCCVHPANIELFANALNYQIELSSELKQNMDLKEKLNTSKYQVNIEMF